MTAYRYVRLGLLPARKDGSLWRVSASDLEAFRRRAEAPARGRGRGRRRAPWHRRLEDRLLAGDMRGAWGVIEAALTAGCEPDDVYVDVISPAMASIGERWANGEIDIAVEHRASGIVSRLMGQMGPRFSRPGRTRGTVVVGAPEGDRHGLPVALVADLLRGAGFDVVDLGPDVPAGSFVFAASDADRLGAVGISATSPDNEAAIRRTIADLRRAVGPSVPILLGGGAISDAAHAQALGADSWASDGRGAVREIERLMAGSAG